MKSSFWRNSILILNTITSVAQYTKNDYRMEQLKSKQKQELIEIAIEILKEKQPSIVIDWADFEVTVLSNSQDILVEWKRKVTFIPLENRFKGVYQYDIAVSLMTACISKSHSLVLNHNDYLQCDSLFNLSNDDRKIIEIAKQAYGDSNEKGQLYVVEKENHYEMIHITDSFRSSQLIEKETFNKGLITHKEKVPQLKSQNYLEIK